ncbi:MAG: hypothetical protein KDC85_11050 [Saprospiraceae bacterium]|nr:hypothetical protein [Saprospiraceae bacterium]MCB9322425.1 hypothetical protein [Lewinellaceae bacterium]
MKRFLSLLLIIFALPAGVFSQEDEDDLLSLLGEEQPTIDFITASFKTNRVINLHSLENTARGVLDVKISHRFGFVSGGIQELYGLDASMVRIGADFGLTDRICIGAGRNSFEKTFDGFLKYKFLRQSKGAKNMPVTAAALASMAIKTIPWRYPDRDNHPSSRLYYTFQLIVGRKFSEGFSLQLSPTLVHRNLVATVNESNDVYALGIAARQKLNKRLAVNAEYIYVFPDQLGSAFTNSLSIGLDIETGGHVFQLHFTNSTSMVPKGYITETVGDWAKGDVHFGFNVSRVFTVVKPKGF